MRFGSTYLSTYPYQCLLEVNLVSFNALPQKSGQLGLLLSFDSDQIEGIVLVGLLIDDAVAMKGLELIADHEALEVRISPFSRGN